MAKKLEIVTQHLVPFDGSVVPVERLQVGPLIKVNFPVSVIIGSVMSLKQFIQILKDLKEHSEYFAVSHILDDKSIGSFDDTMVTHVAGDSINESFPMPELVAMFVAFTNTLVDAKILVPIMRNFLLPGFPIIPNIYYGKESVHISDCEQNSTNIVLQPGSKKGEPQIRALDRHLDTCPLDLVMQCWGPQDRFGLGYFENPLSRLPYYVSHMQKLIATIHQGNVAYHNFVSREPLMENPSDPIQLNPNGLDRDSMGVLSLAFHVVGRDVNGQQIRSQDLVPPNTYPLFYGLETSLV